MSVAASEVQKTPDPTGQKSGFQLPGWAEKGLIPGIFLAIAALLPFIPAIGDKANLMQQLAVALAYVVMALGLNIIVGFAGLLDLGYVAFFAFGAFAVGWFASGHFAYVNNEEGIHVLVGGNALNLPGIHFNFLLILILAIIAAAAASPTAMPSSLAWPSGIAASELVRAASRVAALPGK